MRKKINKITQLGVFNTTFLLLLFLIISCQEQNKGPVTIYLIGDSTMADYSNDYDPGNDYYKTRYPVTGWGQVFQEFFTNMDPAEFGHLFTTDTVIVDDRARGGRSTRTFFQEGRWRKVYEKLRPENVVIMQFGHNDAAENKTERYVNIEGYKEFLRLYVAQSKEKGVIPIILTPVCRNYPWENGRLSNVHGDYPKAAIEVAKETDTYLIDLNQLSMEAFTEKGRDYVTNNYFMNLPAGKYEAYPEGQSDNTHFQPEGAKAVAGLVFEAMKQLKK